MLRMRGPVYHGQQSLNTSAEGQEGSIAAGNSGIRTLVQHLNRHMVMADSIPKTICCSALSHSNLFPPSSMSTTLWPGVDASEGMEHASNNMKQQTTMR